jgi:hypothetical protein
MFDFMLGIRSGRRVDRLVGLGTRILFVLNFDCTTTALADEAADAYEWIQVAN